MAGQGLTQRNFTSTFQLSSFQGKLRLQNEQKWWK